LNALAHPFFLCFLVSFALAELVTTPFGLRPVECVHEVQEDEIASFDDVDEMFRIRKRFPLPNGKEEYTILREYPRCATPFLRQTKDEPNGWPADAYWLTDIQFNEFGGV